MTEQTYRDLAANAASAVKDAGNVSNQIASLIVQMTNVEVLTWLTQQVLIIQSVRVRPGSYSVVMSNVSQSITFSMLSSIVSGLFTETSIKTALQYDLYAKDIERDIKEAETIKSIQQSYEDLKTIFQEIPLDLFITVAAFLFLLVLSGVAFSNFGFLKLSLN